MRGSSHREGGTWKQGPCAEVLFVCMCVFWLCVHVPVSVRQLQAFLLLVADTEAAMYTFASRLKVTAGLAARCQNGGQEDGG